GRRWPPMSMAGRIETGRQGRSRPDRNPLYKFSAINRGRQVPFSAARLIQEVKAHGIDGRRPAARRWTCADDTRTSRKD
ncbi:hypothetical protein, partial [Pseudomonas viridiflava]|uniref:hypothetical protein n=1 Tax=Pseudomonas viridiflava TaxID=33069 RepID=UPI001981ACB7